MLNRLMLALAIAGVAVVAGCGSTARPVTPVSGKITFTDGSNLMDGAKVVFNPVEGNLGISTGVVSSDGSFSLTHVTGRSGAELGKYNVSLLAPDGKEKEFFAGIPSEYSGGGVLTAEVKEGMPPLDFKVAKKQ